MSKKLYNLVLQPGTDEAAFLSNEAAGMDVHDNLNLFDMLLCMMLTEEEAATLKASEKVFEIEAERQVIETSYPTTTPRYESTGATFRTRTYPPTSGNGKNYTGINMFSPVNLILHQGLLGLRLVTLVISILTIQLNLISLESMLI